ncbi:MAG: lipoate--protein ligase [Clostridia bacterium]|nr:lipoate--protein ligase [Clostridia bacterium]
MLLITHNNTDPYFNLASEEYFLRNYDEEIIYLWRNDNAVIVGKHQNTIEEVNQQYVEDHGIKVVRRLTGGGAVFHDINNINYSVILRYEADLFSNYAFFTKPICEYLNTLGVSAELNGRNDITIDGLKFSGNAQAVAGNRIMHHGTLLFCSNTSDIEGALNPSKLKIESKGVKSVKSRVTNISSHLKSEMSIEDFMNGLYDFFRETVPEIKPYTLTEKDIAAIEKLADEKYSTWDWNYGYSPKYSCSNQKKYEFGLVDVRLNVASGVIKNIRIFGDYFAIRDIADIEEALEGCPHEPAAIRRVLESFNIDEYISHMSVDELVSLIL